MCIKDRNGGPLTRLPHPRQSPSHTTGPHGHGHLHSKGLFGCLLKPTRLALGSLGAFGLAKGMQKGMFGYMYDSSSV